MKKVILIILISFNFGRAYIEFDVGFHNPQGSLDKYNESGISFRFTYTHIDELFPFVRYDFSFQRLQFKNDIWYEHYEGFNGPLTYENSEQAFGVFIGPRFMSPTKRGLFRPYVGFKVGGMFFNETLDISWEEPDDEFMECVSSTIIATLLDTGYDCNGETRLLSRDYLDMSFDFGALIELGANMNFSDRFGLDFGVQYNIIPSVRPEVLLEEDLSGGFSLSEIPKTISADYTTFYVGINVKVTK